MSKVHDDNGAQLKAIGTDRQIMRSIERSGTFSVAYCILQNDAAVDQVHIIAFLGDVNDPKLGRIVGTTFDSTRSCFNYYLSFLTKKKEPVNRNEMLL